MPVESKDDFLHKCIALIESEAVRQEKDYLATFGMLAGQDNRIVPIQRALAVWGLTPDDLGMVSIHGTSMQANGKNKTSVYNDVFTNIRRTPGNAVPVIVQKNMTGEHVEFLELSAVKTDMSTQAILKELQLGCWAACARASSLASFLATGMWSKWVLITFRPVDWTLSASNVDSQLQAHKYLLFPSKMIHTDGIKAGIMTSFGFGQVGGLAVIIHPRYLWGAIEPSAYVRYRELNCSQALASYKSMSKMMIANLLIKIKENPPYTPKLKVPVLLNSKACTSPDKTGGYTDYRNQWRPTLLIWSFNSISVDGNMSTNDTVIAFANGATVDPGAEAIDEDKHPKDLETNYSLSTSRFLLPVP